MPGPVLRGIWILGWPIRTYWLHSRRKLGKRLVVDRLVKRLLPPPPSGFEAELPGGARVFLHYREDIGLVTLLSGGFERVELELARRLARAGTTAVDVGANIGLYTAVLAGAVGPRGRVLAFEPEPESARRLEDNVARNGLTNVEVHQVALGDRPGELVLHLAADPAYHSTAAVRERRASGESLRVQARTLDDVWGEAGSPTVSLVKVDTEGGELTALRGAERLLRAERPALLVEAREPQLEVWLRGLGYVPRRPDGFALGNTLFESGSSDALR